MIKASIEGIESLCLNYNLREENSGVITCVTPCDDADCYWKNNGKEEF
jgi:hypothetical protein